MYPITAFGPTVCLPTQMDGQSRLPVIEFQPSDLGKRRLRTGKRPYVPSAIPVRTSYGQATHDVHINEWELFHAMAKVELACTFSAEDVYKSAVAYQMQRGTQFDWTAVELRTRQLWTRRLVDHVKSSFHGLTGEAIAYLVMLDREYVYWDRLEVLLLRCIEHEAVNHDLMIKRWEQLIDFRIDLPGKGSDFLFEASSGARALVEAKGSFVNNDKLSLKGDLTYGLEQLSQWSQRMTPQPSKSYVVGTYLREIGDNNDPSLVALVDPPGDGVSSSEQVEIPDDWVRRGNYGAWLMGMGLFDTANQLRTGSGSNNQDTPGRKVKLPVIKINGHEFVIVLDGLVADEPFISMSPASGWNLFGLSRSPRFDPFLWHMLHRSIESGEDFSRVWRHFQPDVLGARVRGIQKQTMRDIEAALRSPRSQVLLKHIPMKKSSRLSSPGKTVIEGFAGSIFPDGTFVGEVGALVLKNATVEEFAL